MGFALSDYTFQVQNLVHDLSFNDFSQNEITSYVNAARRRVALDFHCVRIFYQNLQTINTQETYPMTGGTGGAVVTNSGSGYLVPPTVTFVGGGGASLVPATGVAVLNAQGGVASIQMTSWGANYTSVPTITFSSGAAAATAITMLNVIDIFNVSCISGTLAWELGWLPFSVFQGFCRAYRVQLDRPGIFSNYTEQNLFYLYPIPNGQYGQEIDAVTLPGNLVATTDIDLQIVPPCDDCVQWYAAHLALIKLQNFSQAEWMLGRYRDRQKEIQATRTTGRRMSVYQNYARRLMTR